MSDRRTFLVGGTAVISQAVTASQVLDYLRLFRIPLERWEIRVVFEIDDAVLPLLNKTSGKREGVHVTDLEGVRAMMNDLTAQQSVKAIK